MHLANNQYVIQNTPVLDLCNEFETPLYVYDGSKIEEKVNILKSTFSDVNMKIKYACKANTNISVLKLMKTLGVELDVVSPQEIQLGLKAGFSPKQITFTSSGVSFDEIENSVENGVLVNIDNLPTLEKFGEKYGNTVPVMLRIRPNVVGGGNLKIMTGHKDSKFGIAIEQKDQILALVNKYNLDVVGLHQHTGSDIKDGQTFVDAAKVMLELAFSFPDLKYMDFGGGFKVFCGGGDAIIGVVGLGKTPTQEFKTFYTKYRKELKL
jgi:diaminopimelate decarboxylase